MKKIFLYLSLFLLSGTLGAVDSVIVVYKFLDGKATSFMAKAERISENVTRITIPKESVPQNVEFMELFPDSGVIKCGSEGFWIFPRGEYGTFKHQKGFYANYTCVMPILGVKSPKECFLAVVEGMKHEMATSARIDDKGFYKISFRWGFKSFKNPYEDFVIDFYTLPQSASYPEMAKVYRKLRMERKQIKPIRERIKNNPNLERLSQSVLARISDFGMKTNPRDPKMADFTPATEPPVNLFLTFDKAGELFKTIKSKGMEDLVVVLSGWQHGGADGACPSVFPIPEMFGGEKKLRELIKLGDELGIFLSANANHTDAYTVSRLWNTDYIAKNINGSLRYCGVLAGGNMYYICLERSWPLFIKDQMEKTRELGFKNSYYIDVYSALPPVQCFDPRHPANRKQIAKIQRKILKYAQNLFGGAASECGFDHCIGNLDYINYVSSSDHYMRKRWNVDIYKGGIVENTIAEGILPFWELVYHGFVVSTPGRVTQNHPMFGSYENTPADMVKLAEFGARPIVYTVRDSTLHVLKKMYDFYAPLKHLQLEFMEDHCKLADGVFLTTFSNGEKIVANYTDKEFDYKGNKVAPVNFLLLKP